MTPHQLRPLSGVCALFLALIGPAAAVAQDVWQTVPGPEGAVIAASQWADGTAIVTRCDHGVLTGFIGVAAPLPGPSAFVMAERRGDAPFGDYWRISANGRAAFVRSPAAFARVLRKGGVLDLVIKARQGPDREMTVTLPGNTTTLDAVLTACDLPLEAPVLGDGVIVWRKTGFDRIGSYYPPGAMVDEVSGIVALDCVAKGDGHVSDCLVVDEMPTGRLFGDYAVAMVERELRVELTPDSTGPLDGRRFTTTIPFEIDSRRRRGPMELPFRARIEVEARPLLAPTVPLPQQPPGP